jgi:hypothetical protein
MTSSQGKRKNTDVFDMTNEIDDPPNNESVKRIKRNLASRDCCANKSNTIENLERKYMDKSPLLVMKLQKMIECLPSNTFPSEVLDILLSYFDEEKSIYILQSEKYDRDDDTSYLSRRYDLFIQESKFTPTSKCILHSEHVKLPINGYGNALSSQCDKLAIDRKQGVLVCVIKEILIAYKLPGMTPLNLQHKLKPNLFIDNIDIQCDEENGFFYISTKPEICRLDVPSLCVQPLLSISTNSCLSRHRILKCPNRGNILICNNDHDAHLRSTKFTFCIPSEPKMHYVATYPSVSPIEYVGWESRSNILSLVCSTWKRDSDDAWIGTISFQWVKLGLETDLVTFAPSCREEKKVIQLSGVTEDVTTVPDLGGGIKSHQTLSSDDKHVLSTDLLVFSTCMVLAELRQTATGEYQPVISILDPPESDCEIETVNNISKDIFLVVCSKKTSKPMRRWSTVGTYHHHDNNMIRTRFIFGVQIIYDGLKRRTKTIWRHNDGFSGETSSAVCF